MSETWVPESMQPILLFSYRFSCLLAPGKVARCQSGGQRRVTISWVTAGQSDVIEISEVFAC
jgi:hypothetical protein